ncbi:MAG: hypothetical protein WAU28_02920 [Candidatus Moraniibacteriota bacterium]
MILESEYKGERTFLEVALVAIISILLAAVIYVVVKSIRKGDTSFLPVVDTMLLSDQKNNEPLTPKGIDMRGGLPGNTPEGAVSLPRPEELNKQLSAPGQETAKGISKMPSPDEMGAVLDTLDKKK